MKKWFCCFAFLVTWKAIGMGERVCDYDVYTGAEVHCEKKDVGHKEAFNTLAGAKDFMAKAPKSGIKDMVVEEKVEDNSIGINFRTQY